MPCYCNRISKLQSELDDLSLANKYINYAIESSTFSKQYIDYCAMYIESGLSVMDAQQEIAENVRLSYTSVPSEISRTSGKVIEAIDNIQSEIRYYSKLDKTYHENERG